MSKNKDRDELLRSQINDIIEGEIQNGINDYIEEKEQRQKTKGFGGDVPEDEGTKLNVKVSNSEVNNILREYKKIMKSKRSNIGQVKKMGLVDKNGKPL